LKEAYSDSHANSFLMDAGSLNRREIAMLHKPGQNRRKSRTRSAGEFARAVGHFNQLQTIDSASNNAEFFD
jgi:hypothetical protein